MTRRQKMTRSLAALAGVCGLALVVGSFRADADRALAGASPAEATEPLPVSVIPVTRVDGIELSRTYTGVITARRSSDLGFDQSARLTELLVDDGHIAQQGQVLARLDTRRLQARRDEMRARLQAAQALLDELQAGPRRETVDAARAEKQDLESQLALAESTLQRVRQLSSRNAVSPQSVDDAVFARDSARARFEASSRRLEELESGTRREKIAAQQAAVTELAAALADIEIAIDDSTLVAPFTGTVAARLVDEGTVVAAGQPVLRLIEHGHLEARIGMPANISDSEMAQSTVSLHVDGQAWPGQFERSLPEVDLQTRTRVVVLKLDPSAASALIPGQIVRAEVTRSVSLQGFWLPTDALSPGVRGMWSAWAVVEEGDQQVVERRLLEIVHVSGDRVLVQGTLSSGDRVIVGGTQRVVPGQQVQVREPRRG